MKIKTNVRAGIIASPRCGGSNTSALRCGGTVRCGGGTVYAL